MTWTLWTLRSTKLEIALRAGPERLLPLRAWNPPVHHALRMMHGSPSVERRKPLTARIAITTLWSHLILVSWSRTPRFVHVLSHHRVGPLRHRSSLPPPGAGQAQAAAVAHAPGLTGTGRPRDRQPRELSEAFEAQLQLRFGCQSFLAPEWCAARWAASTSSPKSAVGSRHTEWA